jgi:hypothetical protein
MARHILRPVPGQIPVHTPRNEFQRAMSWVDGDVYTVSGGNLNRLSADGVPIALGVVADGVNTTIAGNEGYVTVVAGGTYYTWNGTTITEPADGAFSSYGSVDTIGQRMLLTERNGRRFQWSNVADPDTLNGLNFATTESGEDNNIRGLALNGNYLIFKERSTEIWYPTTSDDEAEAFARVSGGVVTTGLKSFNLLARIRGGLFVIGNDDIAYVTTGQSLQPVSTQPVSRSIRDSNPTHCFYYEHEGHKFCVIRFSDRPAWVYDFSTAEWHERSEGVGHDPWDAVEAAQATAGHWLVASDLGSISRFENTEEDKGGFLYRRAISRTMRHDSQRFRVPEVEIYADYGRVATDPAAKVMFRFSGDRGHTWGSERSMSVGDQGQYRNRVLYRSLGQFREFTARLDITHGYEVPLFCDVRLRLA